MMKPAVHVVRRGLFDRFQKGTLPTNTFRRLGCRSPIQLRRIRDPQHGNYGQQNSDGQGPHFRLMAQFVQHSCNPL